MPEGGSRWLVSVYASSARRDATRRGALERETFSITNKKHSWNWFVSFIPRQVINFRSFYFSTGLTLLGVRIGEHNLATERDCEKGESELELVCAERYQDFPVESVHYHPSYTRSKLQNDVGLIRMNADADFRPASVKPICLPARPTLRSLSPTQKVVVTGWGSTETGRQSDDLLQIQLSQISTEACKDIYKAHAPIWHKQICAGGNRSVDSCPGDSGGPLQVPVPYNRNLRYVQYGIVSFGLRNCGTEGFPGVYTNVVYYMDWILDTIRD